MRPQGPLVQLVLKALATFPIGPDDRMIVAVSGGPDSVCLLHLLKQALSDQAHHRLHVAHLNHGFRPEADDEALFVSHLCESWGIPCTVEKRPVSDFCKKNRLSKQEGARLARYAFLDEVAKLRGASWIALGHTADDHIETFLMHLLRGAGAQGLSGIPAMRDGMIIRPMLTITREAILQELQSNAISFREDPSNQDCHFLRNRVRHELIPMLKTYNPNIKKTLLREVTLLAEENRFIQSHVTPLLERADCTTENRLSFDRNMLRSLPKTLQRRLIRGGIGQLHGNLNGITFDHIEIVLTMIAGRPNKSFSLPYQLGVDVTESRLSLLRFPDEQVTQTDPVEIPCEIPWSILTSLTSEATPLDIFPWKLRLSLSLQTRTPSLSLLHKGDCSIFFDFDTLTPPITIRGWQSGDRFIPLGMQGRHKKVQDFFVDQKIQRVRRHHIPLLVCPKGILWVIGHRMDHRFRVTEQTKRILSIRMEEGL